MGFYVNQGFLLLTICMCTYLIGLVRVMVLHRISGIRPHYSYNIDDILSIFLVLFSQEMLEKHFLVKQCEVVREPERSTVHPPFSWVPKCSLWSLVSWSEVSSNSHSNRLCFNGFHDNQRKIWDSRTCKDILITVSMFKI